MTDLLPIVFTRGVNEGVDPRVAPAELLKVVQNVRWRKDGRPAKRYGSAAVSTTGLDASLGYASTRINAVTSLNGAPVLVLGSSVRTLTAAGWSGIPYPKYGEISHWSPGVRDVVARGESGLLVNSSSAVSQGVVLTVWENSTTGLIFYSTKTIAGGVIRAPQLFTTGGYTRCVSAGAFIYVLYRVGSTLNVSVYNPITQSFNAGPTFALSSAVSMYDAVGRSSDFVIAYKSAAGTVTVKTLSAIASPAVLQTQTAALTAAGEPCVMGVAANATANVFLGTCDASGNVQAFTWNNALSAAVGNSILQTDANNRDQPGVVIGSTGAAEYLWGGWTVGTETSYMRAAAVTAAGALSGSISTFFGVSIASKPFNGPAYSSVPSLDGSYVWCHTHNSDQTSGTYSKWDTQRAYLLVNYATGGNAILHRHMHVPGVVPTYATNYQHLSDVCDLGSGYGYMSPLSNAVRYGNKIAPAYGIDTVSIRSVFDSQRNAAIDSAQAGRVLQFSGGSLMEYGSFPEETDFSNIPVIQSITGSGGGSLTLSSNYLYRAVYEYIDQQGRRHRSAPSDPFLFASGANTQATLAIKPAVANSHCPANDVSLHVYRTLANQSTYRRVTSNSAPPSGLAFAATVSYADTMADSVAAGNEILYTDGGVVPNWLCPPHSFQTVCNGRLWVGGQLDGTVVTASKLLVEGEPTQFTDFDAFRTFLPERCTGLASIDGTVVAFARERIFFIGGDGPNDQGSGSFAPPSELPTDVGCIDWRSVVECSLGVLFQSKRGIYLLPRGFNTPQFVGADVEDTLALFPIVLSATLVVESAVSGTAGGEATVRFVVGNADPATSSRVLAFDLRTGGWSVDLDGGFGLYGRSGTWSDVFVATNAVTDGTLDKIREETPGVYSDIGSVIVGKFATADIRPFGVAGYGGFDRVVLVGEFRSASTVDVRVATDAGTIDTFSFGVTSGDGSDGTVYLDVTPSVRLGSSLQVQAQDTPTTPGEGFIMQALFIEHETIGRTKRLATARKK